MTPNDFAEIARCCGPEMVAKVIRAITDGWPARPAKALGEPQELTPRQVAARAAARARWGPAHDTSAWSPHDAQGMRSDAETMRSDVGRSGTDRGLTRVVSEIDPSFLAGSESKEKKSGSERAERAGSGSEPPHDAENDAQVMRGDAQMTLLKGAVAGRPKRVGARTRCPLAEDDSMTVDAWLEREGLPSLKSEHGVEVGAMLDHHAAKGTLAASWRATWATWRRAWTENGGWRERRAGPDVRRVSIQDGDFDPRDGAAIIPDNVRKPRTPDEQAEIDELRRGYERDMAERERAAQAAQNELYASVSSLATKVAT